MMKKLQMHLNRYPKMQLQDVAKLLYQSEFGGGHFITDSSRSLEWIKTEYEHLEDKENGAIVEPIGDGMCRVYLSCLSEGLSAEVLNALFVESANRKRGTIRGLETKIQENWSDMPFPEEEKKEFFQQWKQDGYPALSHSAQYRECYKPAYRVMEESYGKVYEVIRKIANTRPRTIAIEGMCGSGKTTLGELLHMNFPESILIHMDSFFLQPHQRTKERLEEVGGNLDYERFQEEVITHLSDVNGIRYRNYDCSCQQLGEEIMEPWRPLVIIEGVYSHHPRFGKVYDMKLFCSVSPEEQKKRILKRNGEQMWNRFEDEWIPMENRYFDYLEEISGRRLREQDYLSY